MAFECICREQGIMIEMWQHCYRQKTDECVALLYLEIFRSLCRNPAFEVKPLTRIASMHGLFLPPYSYAFDCRSDSFLNIHFPPKGKVSLFIEREMERGKGEKK